MHIRPDVRWTSDSIGSPSWPPPEAPLDVGGQELETGRWQAPEAHVRAHRGGYPDSKGLKMGGSTKTKKGGGVRLKWGS